MLSIIIARAQATPSGKPTIAVMNLQAGNCPPSIARGFTDMLGGKIFETGMFILLERSQVDVLLREQGLSEKSCDDSDCAVRMGRLLSVQKMVTGSVTRIGDYRIEVRIINVADSAVDLSVSSEAETEYDFTRTAERIVTRMKYFYTGMTHISGDFDVSASAMYLFPLGDFSHGASGGTGSRLCVALHELGGSRVSLMIVSGIYRFGSTLRSVDSIHMSPLELMAGYPFRVSDTLMVVPSIGGGYIISRVRYDRVEERTFGEYSYSTAYFYDPVMEARCAFEISLGGRWRLITGPAVTLFFERGRTGSWISAEGGIKMLF
jgi:hypothetical protein